MDDLNLPPLKKRDVNMQPYRVQNNPQNFPIDCLPSLIKNAVQEIQANTQAPLALIVSSALATVSLACQNSVDVRRPNTSESSCSLYLLTIANANEGKTFVDKQFMQPIFDFQDIHDQDIPNLLAEYDSSHQIWELLIKEFKVAIRKSIKKNLTHNSVSEVEMQNKEISGLQKELKKALLMEPEMPKKLKLIFQNTGIEALKNGLRNWPSAGLMSDEAGSIFNSRVMQNLGDINKLWDGGAPQNVDRMEAGKSFTLKDVRFTISLMVQETILKKFMKKHGDSLKDSGLLGRFLITYPYSMQGQKYLESRELSWEHKPIFHRRITEILTQNKLDVDNGMTVRRILKFSPEGAERWRQTFNNVQNCMSQGGDLSGIREFVGKGAENIARMAALFHFFEGREGEISFDTVDRTARICSWYADESRRLFDPSSVISMEQSDAEALAVWLLRKLFMNGINTGIKKNYIRQHNSILRDPGSRFDAAIDWLHGNNRITCYPCQTIGRNGKLDSTTAVNLNVDYFQWLQNSLLQTNHLTRLPSPTSSPLVIPYLGVGGY